MIPPTDEFWSSDPVSQVTSPMEKALGMGGTMAVLGGGLYLAKNTTIGSHSLLDHVQNTVRRAGYASPFALLNTFRSAEWLSPFVTTGSLGLGAQKSIVDPAKSVIQYKYESRFLTSETTREALFDSFPQLKKIAEKDGLKFDLDSNREKLELIFESDARSNSGSLYLKNIEDDTKEGLRKVSDKVSLFEMRSYEVSEEGIQAKTKVNPAMKAMYQASGFVDKLEDRAVSLGLKDADSLIEEIGQAERLKDTPVEKKRFMFVETPGLDKAGLTYARAFPAYGMERIKRLLAGAADQVPIVGKAFEKLDRVIGLSPANIKSGTASKMFARYGMRAGAVGAAYLGVEQLDHYRRNFSLPGEIGVSAIFSAGIGIAAKKAFTSVSAPKSGAIAIGAFAAQMLMPGFDQGVFPGIATTFTNFDVATTALGEVTFMNSYRRTVEGLMPGFSSAEMSVGAGLALTLASGMGTDPISSKIFRRLTEDQKKSLFGAQSPVVQMSELPASRKKFHLSGIHQMGKGEFQTAEAKNLFAAEFQKRGIGFSVDPMVESPGFFEKRKVMQSIFGAASDIGGADAVNVLEKELYQQYNKSLEMRQQVDVIENPLNKSYYQQVESIEQNKINVGKVQSFLERTKSKVVHAFFGASFQGESVIDAAQTTRSKNWLGRYPAVFAVGAIAHGLVSGGLLGSLKGADEKAAEYSGEKLVAVKRGRYWEGGGTPFGGRDTMYHRPHLYHQYMNRVDQKAVWGENEDSISPIAKFIKKNFTYDMERENYFRRPYPITAGAFEDVPVIGNILASTVGQLIKPTKLMHVQDWMRVGPDGNLEYKTQNEIDRPAYSLGGMSHGAPVSPFSFSKVMTGMQYQFRELEGLTGWAKNMFQKATTGQETFGLDAPVLQSANAMASMNDKFWEMELGGGLFLSEPIRRFLPKDRSEIMDYNPIPNQMPSWLPERFHYGDPYRNIKSGSARAPGEGYAALHPELKGVNPEAYPDIYKYKILADLAPTSKEFQTVRQRLYQRRAKGVTSQKENQMMDVSDQLLNEKMTQHLSQVNQNAYDIPVASAVSQAVYGTGVDLFKDTVSPLEYMIPMGFRPSQKLLSHSNAIDQYEYQNLYGTMFSFWDKPIRDWFRPAFYSAAHAMGYSGTPGHVKRANDVNAHFDKMEFYKQMQLAQAAEQNGDSRGKRVALQNAQRTRYGVNPQASAMAIYQSLPDGEKEFFDAFAAAKGRDRERILQMVPADQKELYANLYSRIDSGDQSLYPGSKTTVDEQFLTQKFYELEHHMSEENLPEPDWVGWHKDVDMDDIKVRYVSELGMDLYDVDMYNSKLRAQARRGYLEGAEQALMGGYGMPGDSSIKSLIRNTVNFPNEGQHGITNVNVFNFGSENRSFFHVNDDRRYEIMRMMQNVYE